MVRHYVRPRNRECFENLTPEPCFLQALEREQHNADPAPDVLLAERLSLRAKSVFYTLHIAKTYYHTECIL